MRHVAVGTGILRVLIMVLCIKFNSKEAHRVPHGQAQHREARAGGGGRHLRAGMGHTAVSKPNQCTPV